MMTKIVYVAMDGTKFATLTECMEYNRSLDKGRWYKRTGDRTYNTDEAFIVYFPDTTATKAFISKCNFESDYKGIDPEDHGWFFWDEWNEEYHYIDDGLIQAFRILDI